jgi:hypothetical protein
MADPNYRVAMPRSAPLTEMQIRMARYGNVKIELLGVALAVNQANAIIKEYTAPEEPPPVVSKRDPPKP